MKLRTNRLLYAPALAAAAAALTVVALTGPAASAAPTRAQGPALSAQATHQPRAVRPYNSPCCGEVASVAIPEANTGEFVYDHNGTLWDSDVTYTCLVYNANNMELFEDTGDCPYGTGSNSGKCLYYNSSGNDFDFLACDASKKSDMWYFGNTSHSYSEWQTVYNPGICAWFNAPQAKVPAGGCIGTSSSDRWHWRAAS